MKRTATELLFDIIRNIPEDKDALAVINSLSLSAGYNHSEITLTIGLFGNAGDVISAFNKAAYNQ